MSIPLITSGGFGMVPQQVVSGGGGGVQPVRYLFIDAAYLRERCNEFMKEMFDEEAEIDFNLVKAAFFALKAFYYDCLDDIPKRGEDQATLQARVNEQQERVYAIQSIPGFHVIFGTLTGSRPKRLRQKEVDVQLAVDMLTHAFSKNMDRATLIAGDLDFRPVVTSLIQLGTWVQVACKPEASAQSLRWAADEIYELTVVNTYSWNTDEFRSRNKMPQQLGSRAIPPGASLLKRGTLDGSPISALSHVNGYYVVVERPVGPYALLHSDLVAIERYLKLTVGVPAW